MPAAASGDGLLSVSVTPWAELFLDGRSLGYTPCTVRLPAGTYRLVAANALHGKAQQRVVIAPGKRKTWTPTLSR